MTAIPEKPGVCRDRSQLQAVAVPGSDPLKPQVFKKQSGIILHLLGLQHPQDAIGKSINWDHYTPIVGVMKDFQEDISHLLKWATGLTVLISCLGLLGLVIYTTNHRVKEIGIRKVLGASASRIVAILSKDFIKLVVIAFVIATPIAWWALHQWLDQFAFRTTMSWWVFASSGLGMIVLSVLTQSIQTVRAATANPVKSLKTE